jgi:hypothetical protein
VGHLGYFHSLAILNGAAINMDYTGAFVIPLGISIGVVLLDHMADLCLVF